MQEDWNVRLLNIYKVLEMNEDRGVLNFSALRQSATLVIPSYTPENVFRR